MERQPLRSNLIDSIGYDRATAVLEVEFTSGECYRYFLVPPSVHAGLVAADSAGRYFGSHVRDRYRFERV